MGRRNRSYSPGAVARSTQRIERCSGKRPRRSTNPLPNSSLINWDGLVSCETLSYRADVGDDLKLRRNQCSASGAREKAVRSA